MQHVVLDYKFHLFSGGAIFPSKLNPNDYFKCEEEFTTALTAYTKRQFFEVLLKINYHKFGDNFKDTV